MLNTTFKDTVVTVIWDNLSDCIRLPVLLSTSHYGILNLHPPEPDSEDSKQIVNRPYLPHDDHIRTWCIWCGLRWLTLYHLLLSKMHSYLAIENLLDINLYERMLIFNGLENWHSLYYFVQNLHNLCLAKDTDKMATLAPICVHILCNTHFKITQIELDLCFDIIYQHIKFELNQCSLSKVIERTPNFDNGRTHGRTHARTGVTLNAPPPFFEWRGIKNVLQFWNKHIFISHCLPVNDGGHWHL